MQRLHNLQTELQFTYFSLHYLWYCIAIAVVNNVNGAIKYVGLSGVEQDMKNWEGEKFRAQSETLPAVSIHRISVGPQGVKPLKSGREKTYSRPLHQNLEGHLLCPTAYTEAYVGLGLTLRFSLNKRMKFF